MYITIFDIFKISIGPSSSHTMGPMIASKNFIDKILNGFDPIPGSKKVKKIKCHLYGSLALTGKGHCTDRAICLGLSGLSAEKITKEICIKIEEKISNIGKVSPKKNINFFFNPKNDIIYNKDKYLKEHPNALKLQALDENNNLCFEETFFSIGGGFVIEKNNFGQKIHSKETIPFPFPFSNSEEMLKMSLDSEKSIAQMALENELVIHKKEEINSFLEKIWDIMDESIKLGLESDGILPGGLNLKRRAKNIYKKLMNEKKDNIIAPHIINDWISVYAIAVNEENADGGKIITAPTNGAAGVIPATIKYYLSHVPDARKSDIKKFLLTASAIGSIIKKNASISGAEVGCQGEVGSAAAMAAAGLCAVLNGTTKQIENAAEIALEHHLGMTCDPIKGLVQAPCIERNGLGAIKAISAASLALRGNGEHLVSLDNCIKTMKETGFDMSKKYKETALGGLAVNITNC